MKRLQWTDWIRQAAAEMEDNRAGRELIMAYGEWLQDRLEILPDDLVEVLAQEFNVG
jgi:hypothetical protein